MPLLAQLGLFLLLLEDLLRLLVQLGQVLQQLLAVLHASPGDGNNWHLYGVHYTMTVLLSSSTTEVTQSQAEAYPGLTSVAINVYVG